jgi:hypothetical protein
MPIHAAARQHQHRHPHRALQVALVRGGFAELAPAQRRGLTELTEGSALMPEAAAELQPLLGNQAVQAWLGAPPPPRSCGCGGSCSNCLSDEMAPRTVAALSGPLEDVDDKQLRGLLDRQPQAAAHTAPESSCGCGGRCSLCLQKLHMPRTPGVHTEPLEDFDEEDLKPSTPVSELRPGQGPGVAPDPTAGGTVLCRKGGFEVWINPTMDPCVTDCARKHEEKHAADFKADPDYKDICKGIPDGETFNYKSCDDAARFEDAATDLEIDCLDKQLSGASKACQPVITQRKDTTLPKYKKEVREGCGC